MSKRVWFIGTSGWTRDGGLFIQLLSFMDYVPKSDYILLNKRNVE